MVAPNKRQKGGGEKNRRDKEREGPVGNNLSPRTNNDQTEAGLRERRREMRSCWR